MPNKERVAVYNFQQVSELRTFICSAIAAGVQNQSELVIRQSTDNKQSVDNDYSH